MNDATDSQPAPPRHLWPWIVAAMLIVGVMLSVLGIRHEAQRVREQRQLQMPSSPP